MASINLIEKNVSGSALNTYKVYCNAVNIGWSNSIDAKPYANSLTVGASEVQKNGFDNPLYTVNNTTITETAGTLQYADLVRLAKLSTDGTANYLVLSVDYGLGSTVPLIDSASNTGGVKVVIKSFNMSLGLDKQYGDGQRLMTGTLVLQESS